MRNILTIVSILSRRLPERKSIHSRKRDSNSLFDEFQGIGTRGLDDARKLEFSSKHVALPAVRTLNWEWHGCPLPSGKQILPVLAGFPEIVALS